MAAPRTARTRAVPVSGLGWAVLCVVALLAGAGWWLGWVELMVPAAAGGIALLVAVLLAVGRSTYAVDLDLSDNRVTVGQRAVGRIVVRNTSRRRLLPAEIELPVGHGSADFHLPSLGAHGAHEDVFAIPTTRRAVVPVGPVRSVRGDPLGLIRRRLQWTEPVHLYVHPVLVSLAGTTQGVLRDLEGQATRSLSDSDMSFHALRDYVAGDDRRHIHWRTSARTQTLMVRQFEDTRRTHTAIALSTAHGDWASTEEFETAVAATASLGVQTLREGRDLTVLAGTGRLHTGSPGRFLDDCSALELSVHGTGSLRLATWVAREAADASVAVLVTGSVPTTAELRAQAAHIPPGVRTIVLVCARGGGIEVASHGSLAVTRIGALAELPTVLRRVVTSS